MSKTSVQVAALLVVSLIVPISNVSAQNPSGEVGIATGDVWPSREEYIYVPREALEWSNPGPQGELEMATGDVWPSRKNTPSSQGLVPSIVVDQVQERMSR
jgi:hypothetical protein